MLSVINNVEALRPLVSLFNFPILAPPRAALAIFYLIAALFFLVFMLSGAPAPRSLEVGILFSERYFSKSPP